MPIWFIPFVIALCCYLLVFSIKDSLFGEGNPYD